MDNHATTPPRTNAMRFKKTPLIQIGVDLFLFALAGIPLLIVHILVEPNKYGFFCGDKSIQHPYREDTVPMPLCAVISVIIVMTSFFIIEFSMSLGCKKTNDTRLFNVLWTIAKLTLLFSFGTIVTLIITETGKLSVGRLRPNFIDACKPNMTNINCSSGFIENFVCTNTQIPQKVILDSRKSFPSGHSSFVAFAAFFIGYYYQKRLQTEYSVLLKVFLQMSVTVLATYVTCSRVTDFKHHSSDAIAGVVLGIAVGIWLFMCLGRHINLELRSFRNRHRPPHSPTFDTAQMPMSDPCTPEPANFLSGTPTFDKFHA